MVALVPAELEAPVEKPPSQPPPTWRPSPNDPSTLPSLPSTRSPFFVAPNVSDKPDVLLCV